MTQTRQFAVYLMVSQFNGTFYVGVTSNLQRRIWQHKNKVVDGFTQTYDVDHLVWYELHDNAESAITREKRIKTWKRAWKVRLLERDNPTWRDLYPDICQ